MKLLAIPPRDLIPGATFCWERAFDTTRTVVRLEGNKLVYRLDDRPGVFHQTISGFTPVYLVCVSNQSRRQLNELFHYRRLAKWYCAYYTKRTERANRRQAWPASIQRLKERALAYSRLYHHYESCIHDSLAGVLPADRVRRLPRESWLNTIHCLFTSSFNL